MEANKVLMFSFMSEIDVTNEFDNILIDGEIGMYAYKTIRDIALFTNKRLIIRDAQGLTGKKVETYTIPYSSINMYSTENGGMLEFNCEVELWTRAGDIKIKLKKGIDVSKFDRILANAIL